MNLTLFKKIQAPAKLGMVSTLLGAVLSLSLGVFAAKLALLLWFTYQDTPQVITSPKQINKVESDEKLIFYDVFTQSGSDSVVTQSQSTTKAQLLGTVSNVATIRAGEHTKSYVVGESIDNVGVLTSVKPGTVTIKNGSSYYELKTEPRQSRPKSVNRKTLDVKRVIKQASKDKAALGQLLSTAKLVPRMTGGALNGFKLQEVQPQSPLEQLGLQKGDVIVMVNQTTLDSPEKGISVFRQLEFLDNVELAIERNGTKKTINISLE